MKVIAVIPRAHAEAASCGVGQGVLARSDVEVRCVLPGPHFLDDLLVQRAPDLLLLDADLPNFGAFHAVTALRSWPSHMLTPVFVVSQRDRRQDARASGASAFLLKPVRPDLMEEAVGKYVRPLVRKAARRPLRGPCTVATDEALISGQVHDVSVTGAQVWLPNPLPRGRMVQLGFVVPRPQRPIFVRCDARVVREDRNGYGLAFRALDAESRAALAAYSQH
jgi:CheY-like chemotaxis protein